LIKPSPKLKGRSNKMEEIIRYLFAGFGIGVLFMTAVVLFCVFRLLKKDIERKDK